MGPTAAGKTQLAIELTQKLPCSIISVDSSMVYRGMDIGTAKPSAEELAIAPHRLIDICAPNEVYSAGRFREDAISEIENILAEGKTPLLVGGTMLYFRVLQQGLSDLPKADPDLRARLEIEAKELGNAFLHARLTKIDPIAAAKIKINDKQRLQRALELYELTGKTPTELYAHKFTKSEFINRQEIDKRNEGIYESLRDIDKICKQNCYINQYTISKKQKNQALPYQTINIAITPQDRSVLHEKIIQRFDLMLEQGLIDEVKKLRQHYDLTANLPSMRAIGYRQVWQYLEGELDYAAMREQTIIATRQLAKRQMTWLRSWENGLQWIDDKFTGNEFL